MDYHNLKNNNVNPFNIMRALCHINRYCGNAGNYSVAMHSLLVHDVITNIGFNKEARLLALCHDFTEAAFQDVPWHLKRMPYMAEYCRQEQAWWEVIVEALGISTKDYEFVDNVDKNIVYAEKTFLGLPVCGPPLMESDHIGWVWDRYEKRLEHDLFEQFKTTFLSLL